MNVKKVEIWEILETIDEIELSDSNIQYYFILSIIFENLTNWS
jgi:hypothetical protein